MKYIVELRPGEWLSPLPGEPCRTVVNKSDARRYKTRPAAIAALTRAENHASDWFSFAHFRSVDE